MARSTERNQPIGRRAALALGDVVGRYLVAQPTRAITYSFAFFSAHLVLDVVQESYRLADANVMLDRLADEANIARPETSHMESPLIAPAGPIGALLSRHFRGGQPYQPDENVIRQLRAAIDEKKPQIALVTDTGAAWSALDRRG